MEVSKKKKKKKQERVNNVEAYRNDLYQNILLS